MKATGIVRRIDNLGRVVIPLEIRRTLHIREGDPREIYTAGGGEVVFKKYSPIGEMADVAERMAAALAKKTPYGVAICDQERYVAAAGAGHAQIVDRKIGSGMEKVLDTRRSYLRDGGDGVPLTEDDPSRTAAMVLPVIAAGDIAGGVILHGGEGKAPGEAERMAAQVAAEFFGKSLEA